MGRNLGRVGETAPGRPPSIVRRVRWGEGERSSREGGLDTVPIAATIDGNVEARVIVIRDGGLTEGTGIRVDDVEEVDEVLVRALFDIPPTRRRRLGLRTSSSSRTSPFSKSSSALGNMTLAGRDAAPAAAAAAA